MKKTMAYLRIYEALIMNINTIDTEFKCRLCERCSNKIYDATGVSGLVSSPLLPVGDVTLLGSHKHIIVWRGRNSLFSLLENSCASTPLNSCASETGMQHLPGLIPTVAL